jgi:hypothetical protein
MARHEVEVPDTDPNEPAPGDDREQPSQPEPTNPADNPNDR